jgi:RNA polymerase sigma factor (TIGR02999 family)
MAGERADHTLQATAVVHDAYLRLVDSKKVQRWDSKGHFFSAAAEAMRRILIDHARCKASLKRGGEFQRVDLTACDSDQIGELAAHELLELDEALQRLAEEDQVVAQLVRLRLYAGLSVTEAAQATGISRTVAYQHWDYALAWFAVEFDEARGPAV